MVDGAVEANLSAIRDSANKSLRSSGEHTAHLALQQGGVDLQKGGESLANPFSLTKKPADHVDLILNKFILPPEAVFTLEVAEKLEDVVGLSSLITTLRVQVFTAAASGELVHRWRDYSQSFDEESGVKFTPYKIELPIQQPFLHAILGDQPEISEKIAETEAKIDTCLQVLGTQDASALFYQLAAWQRLIHELGTTLVPNQNNGTPTYDTLVANHKVRLDQPKRDQGITSGENFAQHFQRLIKEGVTIEQVRNKLGDLGDDENIAGRRRLVARLHHSQRYLQSLLEKQIIDRGEYEQNIGELSLRTDELAQLEELASNKNERLSDDDWTQSFSDTFSNRSQSKLYELYQRAYRMEARYRLQSLSAPNQSEMLAEALTEEFLKTTFALNELRVLNMVHDPSEGVDLFALRDQVDAIKAKAQEAKSDPEQLTKLDDELAGLLAPIANRIANIFPHDSASFLSVVLTRGEAICAGKVNALLPVIKFLGLEAVNVVVNEPLALSSFNTGHAVVEAKLFTQHLVIDANYRRHTHSNNQTLQQLFDENANHILPNYEVYAYFMSNTQRQEYDGACIRVNPYTGDKETYYSSIPHPHLYLNPDLPETSIPSSVVGNLGLEIRKLGQIHLYPRMLGRARSSNQFDHEILGETGFFFDLVDNINLAEKVLLYALKVKPDYLNNHFRLAEFYKRHKDYYESKPDGKLKMEACLAHAQEFLRLARHYPNLDEILQDANSRHMFKQVESLVKEFEPKEPSNTET